MDHDKKKKTVFQAFGDLVRGSGKETASQSCGCGSVSQSTSCCSSSVTGASASAGEVLYSSKELSNSDKGTANQGCGCGK
jgi:hypothetical protein